MWRLLPSWEREFTPCWKQQWTHAASFLTAASVPHSGLQLGQTAALLLLLGGEQRNIRQLFKGYCCPASDLWHAGQILMCHAAGGKESGIEVMNKKEFAYPISVSFWIWLELTVVRLCLSPVFTHASLTAEGQNQLLFCLQGLSFFRETLQWIFFKLFSFQLRQQIPF